MRFLALVACCLALLPSVAAAQNAEYTFNTYARDTKKETDAGWAELQAADASSTREERCGHASRAVYLYDEAGRLTQTMVEILANSGDREIYDHGVELRDAARDVAQQVHDLYNRHCT